MKKEVFPYLVANIFILLNLTSCADYVYTTYIDYLNNTESTITIECYIDAEEPEKVITIAPGDNYIDLHNSVGFYEPFQEYYELHISSEEVMVTEKATLPLSGLFDIHNYQILIKEYPQLLQRVSLKEIASYLNITPQSLSRIRAHLK